LGIPLVSVASRLEKSFGVQVGLDQFRSLAMKNEPPDIMVGELYDFIRGVIPKTGVLDLDLDADALWPVYQGAISDTLCVGVEVVSKEKWLIHDLGVERPWTRCRYCHEWVDPEQDDAHRFEHTRLRPDGQLREYVTLRPEDRYQGSLEGVPRVYLHRRCGQRTVMPEEITRTYLENPYTYMADRSYCVGCRKHVRCRELAWVETGENMQDYNDRLRASRPEMRPPLPIRMLALIFRLIPLP
jgi:hypothetical protein